MTLAGKGTNQAQAPADATSKQARSAAAAAAARRNDTPPRALPLEVRGIHVTGPLASLPGRFDEYLAMTRLGLNAIELDVKDEGGIVSFRADVPLARSAGAIRSYYDASAVVRKAHRAGVHMIGRIVVFQDPIVARARPDLAIRRRDGSVWTTGQGLAWLNPYDRRTWGYAVSIAEAAARAGFDEVMFDYVRFPTDGDIASAVYPAKTTQPRARLIEDFVQYAKRRLARTNVRVSAALFGLAASQDLGIGQLPRFLSRHLDSVSPMAYPALYGKGQLGIDHPTRQPGETVFRTLSDYRDQVGETELLVPWIQDWDYAPELVKAQVEAARLQGAKGFLLWNAEGRYTAEALAPPAAG
jgi:hypothetical protein